MSDITTTNMDVDVDYSTSVPDATAEAGAGGDTISILSEANRPIRPNLDKLIQPGLTNDYTIVQFSLIHDITTRGMDVDYDLPVGAHGAWGALQRYDSSALQGNIQWSLDQFASVISSKPITEVEYIVGSGIPAAVPLGTNDPEAGGTGRDKYDIKVLPVIGKFYEVDGLTGLEGYGWDQINRQYGRLKVIVNDVFGAAMSGQGVLIIQEDAYILTGSEGNVAYDIPAQTVDVTSLRGSLTKTAVIAALAQTVLEFSYAGLVITVLNGGNLPVIGTPILIQEADDGENTTQNTDMGGEAIFNNVKISKTYRITVLNYYRDQATGGEGLPIYLTFSPDTILDWNPPAGYPSTIGNVVFYVWDYHTKKPIDGLSIKAYDENLDWYIETGSGVGAVVLPASNTSPLSFTVEVAGIVDKRYSPFKELITLEEDEIRIIDRYLHRKAQESQY